MARRQQWPHVRPGLDHAFQAPVQTAEEHGDFFALGPLEGSGLGRLLGQAGRACRRCCRRWEFALQHCFHGDADLLQRLPGPGRRGVCGASRGGFRRNGRSCARQRMVVAGKRRIEIGAASWPTPGESGNFSSATATTADMAASALASASALRGLTALLPGPRLAASRIARLLRRPLAGHKRAEICHRNGLPDTRPSAKPAPGRQETFAGRCRLAAARRTPVIRIPATAEGRTAASREPIASTGIRPSNFVRCLGSASTKH